MDISDVGIVITICTQPLRHPHRIKRHMILISKTLMCDRHSNIPRKHQRASVHSQVPRAEFALLYRKIVTVIWFCHSRLRFSIYCRMQYSYSDGCCSQEQSDSKVKEYSVYDTHVVPVCFFFNSGMRYLCPSYVRTPTRKTKLYLYVYVC